MLCSVDPLLGSFGFLCCEWHRHKLGVSVEEGTLVFVAHIGACSLCAVCMPRLKPHALSSIR